MDLAITSPAAKKTPTTKTTRNTAAKHCRTLSCGITNSGCHGHWVWLTPYIHTYIHIFSCRFCSDVILSRDSLFTLPWWSAARIPALHLCAMLLLIINRKPYMHGESNDTITFDLEWPWRVKVKVTYILNGKRGVCYTYIYQYCITTVIYLSQKGLMQPGGIFRCPSSLSCYRLRAKLSHIFMQIEISQSR